MRMAGVGEAASGRMAAVAERPARDQRRGLGRRVRCRLQQAAVDRHRQPGAEQHQASRRRHRGRRGVQRDQRTHRMADQHRPVRPQPCHQPVEPVRHRRDRRQGRAAGAAVAGQVDRQRGAPAGRAQPGQVAPGLGIETGAMDEQQRRSRGRAEPLDPDRPVVEAHAHAPAMPHSRATVDVIVIMGRRRAAHCGRRRCGLDSWQDMRRRR
ncbi:MAG: hypothetical protein R3F55_21270 [Alphaproteobacteria bacterium]